MVMFRRRFFVSSLLLLLLGVGIHNPFARANLFCAETCLYLPVVNFAPPIKINEYLVRGGLGQSLRVTGSVMPTISSPVYDVNIEMNVFDPNDQLLATAVGRPVFTTTLPGQMNFFDFGVVVEDEQQVARTEIILLGGSLTETQTHFAPTIVMTDVQTMIYVGYSLQGQIRNDHSFPLTQVQGVSWTLNQVAMMDPILITDFLAPGEVADFSWEFYDPYFAGFFYPLRIAFQGVAAPP
jgi:hypothetical protein